MKIIVEVNALGNVVDAWIGEKRAGLVGVQRIFAWAARPDAGEVAASVDAAVAALEADAVNVDVTALTRQQIIDAVDGLLATKAGQLPDEAPEKEEAEEEYDDEYESLTVDELKEEIDERNAAREAAVGEGEEYDRIPKTGNKADLIESLRLADRGVVADD